MQSRPKAVWNPALTPLPKKVPKSKSGKWNSFSEIYFHCASLTRLWLSLQSKEKNWEKIFKQHHSALDLIGCRSSCSVWSNHPFFLPSQRHRDPPEVPRRSLSSTCDVSRGCGTLAGPTTSDRDQTENNTWDPGLCIYMHYGLVGDGTSSTLQFHHHLILILNTKLQCNVGEKSSAMCRTALWWLVFNKHCLCNKRRDPS